MKILESVVIHRKFGTEVEFINFIVINDTCDSHYFYHSYTNKSFLYIAIDIGDMLLLHIIIYIGDFHSSQHSPYHMLLLIVYFHLSLLEYIVDSSLKLPSLSIITSL